MDGQTNVVGRIGWQRDRRIWRKEKLFVFRPSRRKPTGRIPGHARNLFACGPAEAAVYEPRGFGRNIMTRKIPAVAFMKTSKIQTNVATMSYDDCSSIKLEMLPTN
jgi:hypothetical protein